MRVSDAAVFIDKDGTLVENVPYNVDPAKIRLARGAADAVRAVRDSGFRVFVVSNQSGIARGYFDEAALARAEEALREMLADAGTSIDAFYYCPHLAGRRCPSTTSNANAASPRPGCWSAQRASTRSTCSRRG